MSNIRLATFTCEECGDHGFVPEPFEGKELIPCPVCSATFETTTGGPDARLVEAIDTIDRLVMSAPRGDYRDGLQAALDAVLELTNRRAVDLADADEEPDYDPAA